MEKATPHRTLIVANLTAATPFLLQEVTRLATERPTNFHLLIPNVDPNRTGDWSLEGATKLLSRAAGSKVEGSLGGQDPFESIRGAVAGGNYDDILISTLPKRRSEWLRKDLPTRVETLGLPVKVITPPEEPSSLKQFTEQFSARSS
ncbi:MAG: hypothetical protein JO168_26040 [Solirubrobacterales bacterium]|nr:hypothetical protein [Solirubrobacterales bacterium]